jgi:hypothetical protein
VSYLDFVYSPDQPEAFTFQDGEVVSFAIESVLPDQRGFTVYDRVLSGEFTGRLAIIPFSRETAKGQELWTTRNFLKLFYAWQELTTGMDTEKMIGQTFRALSRVKESQTGRAFQNWDRFEKTYASSF